MIVLADHIGSEPASVVSAAKKAKERRDYEVEHQRTIEDKFEEIWVVFDTEGPQNQVRQRAAKHAIEQCRELGFHTAVSNPCFEFWVLLHFVYHVQPINDGAAAVKLVRGHIPGYVKGDDSFEVLRDKLPKAMDHARRLMRERYEVLSKPHPCDCHPSTQVHLLMKKIMQ